MSVCRLRRVLLPVGLVLSLVACGESAEHDGPVPTGGSIVTAPSALTITTAKMTGGMGCADGVTIQRQVLISTFDQSGAPRGNVDIDLFIDFADLGITGIGTIGTGFISTTTDDFGNRTVVIFLNVSENCEYTGSLTVSSGSVVADMAFDVAN